MPVPGFFFPKKLEGICQFFDKCGYPVSVVQASHHRAQQIELIDSQHQSGQELDALWW